MTPEKSRTFIEAMLGQLQVAHKTRFSHALMHHAFGKIRWEEPAGWCISIADWVKANAATYRVTYVEDFDTYEIERRG